MTTMTTPRPLTVRAFTIVELIAAVVCVAILSGIAIPRFHDYHTRARDEACKGALTGMRAAIAHFYANSATDANAARWPTLVELRTPGLVMQERIPPNPYIADANAAALIIAGVWPTSGEPPVEETPTAGWRYDPASGRIWANSTSRASTAAEGPESTW
jgi:type II secretory pathway pseudopilin PulG